MYDLIVVGGGPAGLTATIYAIRKRINVLLVSKDLGGKTNYTLGIPWAEEHHVIRGLEVVDKFRRELEYLNFARHMEPVEQIRKDGDKYQITTKGGGDLSAKAVIVATGARQQRLNVPGEKEFTMRGLCYSAVSYSPLFIDRTAIIVGDGELALRSAAEMATVAKAVILVGPKGTVLDTDLGKKLQSDEKVDVLEGYQVVRVIGNDYAERLEVKAPDGKLSEISADGTFVEMALQPNSAMVADLLDLNEWGSIKVDCYNRTSVPGIFAAGDVTDTYAEQVLVAIGEGAKAALSAYDYLLPKL
jgi:alkyl hydroperoxide reductase subunit F